MLHDTSTDARPESSTISAPRRDAPARSPPDAWPRQSASHATELRIANDFLGCSAPPLEQDAVTEPPSTATPRDNRSDPSPIALSWSGSAWHKESTFHQLSPYIGKTKSSMAASLVTAFSNRGDIVYDPFSGCGSVALEAWRLGRHVVANDLSPYASLLTRAKLFPCDSLSRALSEIDVLSGQISRRRRPPDLRTVPVWVRRFFHRETLREVLAWVNALKAERRWFLLACLMGILHHQRPGFLSFPSSHTVPYLREKKFPRRYYPEMYEYRPLRERLEAKVRRAFRRVPLLDSRVRRRCFTSDASTLTPLPPVSTILTSPPYMRQLDYGRDNRLRLWFLDCDDYRALDATVSPRESGFLELMRLCFRHWQTVLVPGGYCVLILGDRCSRGGTTDLPGLVAEIATTQASYSLVASHTDTIPNDRRVRRGLVGSMSEVILVLRHLPSSSRDTVRR